MGALGPDTTSAPGWLIHAGAGPLRQAAASRTGEAEIERGQGSTHRHAPVKRHGDAQSAVATAPGLINISLKRCIDPGLVEARKTSPQRYAYYLTARELTEKPRLGEIATSRDTCAALAEQVGHARILIPGLLRLQLADIPEMPA